MSSVLNDSQAYEDILGLVPQQEPFRFLDTITKLNDEHIEGHYQFKSDSWFYQGMPANAKVTPTGILIEAMAQVGVVAFGLHKLKAQYQDRDDIATTDFVSLFTDVQVDFHKEVPAGAHIRITADLNFWRRHKIRSQVKVFDEQNELVGEGSFSGMAVKR